MTYLLEHLLSTTAQKFPEKEAVIHSTNKITYKDLELLSNKLAVVLKEQGVLRGDRVGIYMNKSIPAVISIHAILKAGAAYVPLDPNAPLPRLAYIINNAGIACLLTSTNKSSQVLNLLDEKTSLQTIIITDSASTALDTLPCNTIPWSKVISRDETGPPLNESIETDLAYILYTSGSTGEPKGVMISHRNALTFVDWSCNEFGINDSDHVSSHAPFHFDLSIFDIFTSIKAGATIHLVPGECSVFPKMLTKFIQNNKITVWYSVPSILVHLLVHSQLEVNSFPDLRLVLFAGEVFPVKYLRELMEKIPQADYHNLYGPTETNVCTFYHVHNIAPDATKPIPIGIACKNTEVFALDENMQKISVPNKKGELYVRGPCVAQGYWGDHNKTQTNFVNNSLNPDFTEIMYATGDLVMLDETDNYHLIGRKDHMIKSRGYRIELGEIETALYAHPDIKEAAVVAIPDELITNKLKAFIVLIESATLEKIDVEKYLSDRIPHYMVPESIEFRNALPKTSTGKVDRTNLVVS